jgi:hypothetical protein
MSARERYNSFVYDTSGEHRPIHPVELRQQFLNVGNGFYVARFGNATPYGDVQVEVARTLASGAVEARLLTANPAGPLWRIWRLGAVDYGEPELYTDEE